MDLYGEIASNFFNLQILQSTPHCLLMPYILTKPQYTLGAVSGPHAVGTAFNFASETGSCMGAHLVVSHTVLYGSSAVVHAYGFQSLKTLIGNMPTMTGKASTLYPVPDRVTLYASNHYCN